MYFIRQFSKKNIKNILVTIITGTIIGTLLTIYPVCSAADKLTNDKPVGHDHTPTKSPEKDKKSKSITPSSTIADIYTISIIVMGQGEDLFSRFGHIAIMVDDKKHKTRKVYNFGTFNFEDPDLMISYARGFLNYWVSLASYSNIIRTYRYLNRDVWVRILDLTPAQAEQIAHKLEINILPENREYLYRHYWDNCSTRIRDIIDNATNGALSKKFQQKYTNNDFRFWTEKTLSGLPIFQSIILYSLGSAIDKPITRWDEHFLPLTLGDDLDKVFLGPDNRSLVKTKIHVVKRTGATIDQIIPFGDYIIIASLFALLAIGLLLPIAFGKNLWRTQKITIRLTGFGLIIWGLLAGLGGVMLFLYWTITSHFDTHYNENLLINPFLHLWLVGPGFMLLIKARLKDRTKKILNYYLQASMLLIVIDIALKIGPFIQGNWNVIILAILCNMAAIFALKRTGIIKDLLLFKKTIKK